MIERGTGMILDRIDDRQAESLSGHVVAPRFGSFSASPITATMDLVDLDEEAAAWPAHDQGMTNYCTRYALCDAMSRLDPDWPRMAFSPHFLAWVDAPTERGRNLGQSIFVSAAAAEKHGVCTSMAFPPAVFGEAPEDRVAITPPSHAFEEAARHQVVSHYRILDGDVGTCHEALTRGLSVVFGLLLREGFRRPVLGVVDNRGREIGWHAMLLRGFVAIGADIYGVVRNSWGSNWGRNGYCLLSLGELRLARDLRVIVETELSPQEVIRA